MRVAAVMALIMVLDACSGSTAAVHASPTVFATATASPTRSPSVAVPTPTPVATSTPGDLPLSRVSFSCRLPVLMVPQEGNFQGAFITFPASTMAPDPAGLITNNVSSSLLRTGQSPVLSGDSGLGTGLPFYDAAERRWLPVGAGQASPDGSHYAYVDRSSLASSKLMQVHVVDVTRAVDRTFSFVPPTPGATWTQVADFDGAGVSLVYGNGQSYSDHGVWRLDATTGRVASPAQVANVESVQAGIAWVGLNDPHDPNPPGGGQSFDTLIAVNLATSMRTVWAYKPGSIISLASVDASGHPTVTLLDPPDYVSGTTERLVAPGTADFVYTDLDHWSVQADGNRLWFGNDRGVYLYTPAAGMQKVFALPANDGIGLAPAGFCR
jgi:hypothetical protein